MNKTDLAREIVNEYIDLAIKHNTSYSKRFIATVLHSKHPDIFKDIEAARFNIRVVTGANGANKFKKDEQLTRDFALLENPIIECDFSPYEISEQYNKALVIADIHSRFYDKNAVEIAVNYGIKRGANVCIINGDLFDFYNQSRFDKNPNIMKYFWSEREWVQDFLLLLQNCFGKVIFKKGNHDIRREVLLHKLSATVEEISGLSDLSDYCFFDGSTVEIVEDYNPIQLGKLNIIHGHEYQGGGGIHVAYNRLNKAFDNVMSAHSHITNSVFKTSINNVYYGSWSIGCLCNLHPRYNPINNWNNGFAFVEREKNGNFEVENKQIFNGRVF